MLSFLIIDPPYAERTASFFPSASGLGFPSSSNFSGAIMRSSLIGKTLLCAPVSTFHWILIFRFFSGWVISSVVKASSHVSCIECRVSSMVLTLMVLIVRISSSSSSPLSSILWITFFEGQLFSLVRLFQFAGPGDRLPMISFAAFSTWCTVGWTFVSRVLFSAVVTEFPFLFLINGINTPVPLMAFTTSC